MASPKDIANRWPITAALMLATLMNTLDSTIANVALPHIQGSVSAAQDQVTWVLTSYIIAAALMTPLSGWMALRIGRRRMFLMSIFGFTVTSMLCGIATSLPEIVIFRFLQGIAGASMMPLSQNVMLDIFPPERLPTVMALWSSAIMVGPIMGPVLGGWLTENLTWRWVFYINLPIGILAYLGLYLYMENDEGGQQRPFDFLGFGALVMFILGLQLMLDRGPSQDWFSSREIWIEGAIALVGIWVFTVQTMTAEHPFFHRDLIKDANFVTTTVFGFFTACLMFSASALLPSMMQGLMGYTALQSGNASVTRGLGSLAAFITIPLLLRRFGPHRVLLVGLSISVIAYWQMAHFDLSMTAGPIMLSGLLLGLGSGMMFTPTTTLAYATLSPVHRTEGTIVSTIARNLGSAVGISALSAGVINQTAVAHAALAGHLDPTDPTLRAGLPAMMVPGDPSNPASSMMLNGEVTRQAGMIAYDQAFSWVILLVLCMVPMLLILRSPKQPAPTSFEAAD